MTDSIRLEEQADFGNIRQLTIDAFTQSDFGYHGEAELIDGLRQQSEFWLSLVAHRENQLVGNVCFSSVALKSADNDLQGAGIGPMAVTPSRQRQGIGQSLLREGMARVFAMHHPFIVVLGDPAYYSKFGLVPASEFGIRHCFSSVPQEYFQIAIRDKESWQVTEGSAIYHSLFGMQE